MMLGHIGGYEREGRAKKLSKTKKINSSKKKEVDVEEHYEEDDSHSEVDEVDAQDVDSKLNDIVDNFNIKSVSRRVHYLKTFLHHLNSHPLSDYLQDREETIHMYLSNNLKTGSEEELELACRIVGVMALVLGQGRPATAHLNSYWSLLSSTLNDASKSDQDRAAAAQSMGILAFVCFRDSQPDLFERMESFAAVWQKEKLALETLTQCLESWGLLASSLPESVLGGKVMEKNVPLLAHLLDNKSMDVRAAAGQNMALIYAAYKESPQRDYEEEKQKKTRIDIRRLVDKLEDLVTESGHRMSKKDKLQQRSYFRFVLKAFQGASEVPAEIIKIDNVKHEVVGWPAIIQLSAVRAILQEGWQWHAANTEFIGDLFGFDQVQATTDVDEMEIYNKKEMYRLRDKADYEAKNKARNKKNAFRHVDEDDD